mmetsp:Transcript_8673/g.21338  ORF Transcript_8673/g.21338 Transcript_8673/m.21338 type:complete len:209 (+) Transcript_8673:48-674(+)
MDSNQHERHTRPHALYVLIHMYVPSSYSKLCTHNDRQQLDQQPTTDRTDSHTASVHSFHPSVYLLDDPEHVPPSPVDGVDVPLLVVGHPPTHYADVLLQLVQIRRTYQRAAHEWPAIDPLQRQVGEIRVSVEHCRLVQLHHCPGRQRRPVSLHVGREFEHPASRRVVNCLKILAAQNAPGQRRIRQQSNAGVLRPGELHKSLLDVVAV